MLTTCTDAAVPAASVPILLKLTVLEFASMRRPMPPLPEMMLPSVCVSPPMVAVLARLSMPWDELGRAAAPAAFVPILLPTIWAPVDPDSRKMPIAFPEMRLPRLAPEPPHFRKRYR